MPPLFYSTRVTFPGPAPALFPQMVVWFILFLLIAVYLPILLSNYLAFPDSFPFFIDPGIPEQRFGIL